MKAMSFLGVEILYWMMGQPQVEQNDVEFLNKVVSNCSLYKKDIKSFTCWHQHSLNHRIGRNTNGALTFFEKNAMNDMEVESINTQDIIFLPSKWAYDIIKNDKRIKAKPVHVRMGVDSNFFRPATDGNHDRPYRFFNIGKIEVRKGHDILHKLFNKAFTVEDNVELWISWSNPFMDQNEHNEWHQKYMETPMGKAGKIKFIDRVGRGQLPEIYNMMDCGIFPTRAEGCGLPMMEMMACGKPIITTNYSAHTDFCNDHNSLLVEINDLEPCYDGKWFNGDGKWAHLDMNDQDEQFIDHMRKCYQTRYSFNYQGRQDMEKLSWENTASEIIEAY